MESHLASHSNSVINLFESIRPSLVAISSETKKFGSGFVWDTNGYILSCGSFIRKENGLEVTFSDGRTFPLKVVGHDAFTDVALTKIEADNLKAISSGAVGSTNVKTGQLIFALASSNARHQGIIQGLVTSPKAPLVHRIKGKIIVGNFITADLRLSLVYLGGPVVDHEGNLVGLDTAFIRGRGILVGVNKLKSIVQELEKQGRIRYAHLGITIREIALPKDLAQQDGGLIVLSVRKDTPSFLAGMSIGDVIVKFNNQPIYNLPDLRELLTYDTIGHSVNLSVLRGGKLLDLKITPAQMSDQDLL